jgi:hypothetical protein
MTTRKSRPRNGAAKSESTYPRTCYTTLGVASSLDADQLEAVRRLIAWARQRVCLAGVALKARDCVGSEAALASLFRVDGPRNFREVFGVSAGAKDFQSRKEPL